MAFGFRKGKMQITCTRCGYKWYKLPADAEKKIFGISKMKLMRNIKMETDTKENNTDTKNSIDEMIENWDVVICHQCGKEISMLNADLIEEKYFVCKERC